MQSYKYDLNGTNVTSVEDFLSRDPSTDTLTWRAPDNGDKTKKLAITKYNIHKGSISGVGSIFGGMLLAEQL